MGDDNGRALLEEQKLRLEIRDLSRPWYAKPVYLQALFPLLVGIASVAVLWNRGLFDAERANQQLELTQIAGEKSRLQKEVSNLEKQEKEAEAERASISSQIQVAREQLRDTSFALRAALAKETALKPVLEQYLRTTDEFAQAQQTATFAQIDVLTDQQDNFRTLKADIQRKAAQTDEERRRIDAELAAETTATREDDQKKKDQIAELTTKSKKRADEIRGAFQDLINERTSVLQSLGVCRE